MNKWTKKNNLIQAEHVKYEPLDDPHENPQPIVIPIDMNEDPDEMGSELSIIIGGVFLTLTILLSAYLAYVE